MKTTLVLLAMLLALTACGGEGEEVAVEGDYIEPVVFTDDSAADIAERQEQATRSIDSFLTNHFTEYEHDDVLGWITDGCAFGRELGDDAGKTALTVQLPEAEQRSIDELWAMGTLLYCPEINALFADVEPKPTLETQVFYDAMAIFEMGEDDARVMGENICRIAGGLGFVEGFEDLVKGAQDTEDAEGLRVTYNLGVLTLCPQHQDGDPIPAAEPGRTATASTKRSYYNVARELDPLFENLTDADFAGLADATCVYVDLLGYEVGIEYSVDELTDTDLFSEDVARELSIASVWGFCPELIDT